MSAEAFREVAPETIHEEAPRGLESLEGEIDLIVSLLATAIVAGEVERELVDQATAVFEATIIPSIRENIVEGASTVIGYPLVDAVELVDCIGPEALADTLSWAVGALAYYPSQAHAGDEVHLYADCLGWEADPGNLPPLTAASAVIASFVAALNKYLAGST